MHTSKSLEIHVADHCNLDCVGCSHDSPFLVRRYEDPAQLQIALGTLWRHYRAKTIKLVGGEPLLHPDIRDVIRVVRECCKTTVRLVTNGTLLNRYSDRLRGVDEIHISAYPSQHLPTDAELLSIARELNAPVTIQTFAAFRWHRAPHDAESHVEERIFRTCQMFHRWQCHTIRNGRFYPCPPAATWSHTGESISLLDTGVEVATELDRLLVRTQPFAACAACLGSVGTLIPHTVGARSTLASAPAGAIDERFLRELEVSPDAWNGCYQYARTLHPSGDVQQHVEP